MQYADDFAAGRLTSNHYLAILLTRSAKSKVKWIRIALRCKAIQNTVVQSTKHTVTSLDSRYTQQPVMHCSVTAQCNVHGAMCTRWIYRAASMGGPLLLPNIPHNEQDHKCDGVESAF